MKILCKIMAIVMAFIAAIAVAGFDVRASDIGYDEYRATYKIIADVLNVRYGAGTQYESFFTLKSGEEVQGKTDINGWTEINCYGYKGFVCTKYLQEKKGTVCNIGKMKLLGVYYVTGYNPFCKHCCGKSPSHPAFGLTASGAKAVAGETVAMSSIPFGTKIYIKGLGYYTVHDRGVGRGMVDVACNSHSECYAITGNYEVYIVE